MKLSWTIELQKILQGARAQIPDSEFCGIGVVLYIDFNSLPVMPLCKGQTICKESNLTSQLAQASLYSSDCHDGFHLIDTDIKLTHINQYFAPPIPREIDFPSGEVATYGARYMSARLGSLLSSVAVTGIISRNEGLVVFEDGVELR